jgi:hypothetical protein
MFPIETDFFEMSCCADVTLTFWVGLLDESNDLA